MELGIIDHYFSEEIWGNKFLNHIYRWRLNSKEFGYPLSKKGILRGYIKYGVFAYLSWHMFKKAITPSHHGHGHGHGDDHSHGHGDHHGHSHGESHAAGHGEGHAKEEGHHWALTFI